MSAPRIFVASPTPGHVKTGYMQCIIATLLDLGSRGIQCEFATEEGSIPEMQRNLLATRFLKGSCTHLMFYDTDMMFPGDLCARMLAARKPLIGAIYSARRANAGPIEQAMKRGLSFSDASLFGCDWVHHPLSDDSPIKVEDGLMQVSAVGFGAVLIERRVFETMIEKDLAKPQKRTNEHVGEFHNFFLPHLDSIRRGQHISEDISFCRRWHRDCGGEVWALANVTIFHIGDFGYGGSYFAYLEAINRLAHAPPGHP